MIAKYGWNSFVKSVHYMSGIVDLLLQMFCFFFFFATGYTDSLNKVECGNQVEPS